MPLPLFSQKINYLYEKLGYSENEFTHLFRNPNAKTTLAARKKAVIGNWLRQGIEQPHNFEFENYPVAQLNIDGVKVFSRHAFLDEAMESFVARVDNFVANRVTQEHYFDFPYRYIYYFDRVYQEIKYLTLEIIDGFSPQKAKIKIVPPKIYQDASAYNGTLTTLTDYYHISVENSFEIMSFYFAINKGFTDKKIIHGLRLGLSYDARLPISGKTILSQKILDQDEMDEIYLHLNESEYLLVDSSQNNRYSNFKKSFVSKIGNSIQNLTLFTKKMRKLFKERLFDDVYFNIYYKSFLSLHKISQRVSQEKTYYVASRERATKIFLETIAAKGSVECHIVYPLFRHYDTISDEQNHPDVQEDMELNIQIAKQGVKIVRVFVIDDAYKMTNYFQTITTRMLESGIMIYIVHKKEIDHLVTSYDFIYSKAIGVVGYRNMEERKCYFKISKDSDKIKNIENDFRKIESRSVKFQEFLHKPPMHYNKALHDLIGEWHYYFYGSMEDEGETKVWNILVRINANKEVEHIDKKSHTILHSGVVDTTFNEYQSIIQTTDHQSGNLMLMMIDNQESYKSLFKVSHIDKEKGRYRNMASFGILSRKELSKYEIIEVLGDDVTQTQLIENRDFEDKVNKFHLRVQGNG